MVSLDRNAFRRGVYDTMTFAALRSSQLWRPLGQTIAKLIQMLADGYVYKESGATEEQVKARDKLRH